MSKNKLTIPSGWSQKSFRDCFQVAPKLEGLKKTEYQIVGTYPIIDQSQGFISAYTENNSLVQEKYPAIVFGDHTRILKYINFPYVLGNDGTKVFWEKEGNNLRFLYYVLVNLEIPNTGYNRHFKYLDSAKFLIPPKPEQQKIAEILGAVDEGIEKTEEVIRVTEKLKRGMMRDLLKKGVGHTKFKKTKSGEIPEGWNVEDLGKIALVNPSTRISLKDSDVVGFITMSDVSNDAKVENVQEKSFSDVKKGYTQFLPKDVLFAKITPCMENGKGGVCPDLGYKTYFGSTEFHVIRGTDKIISGFIHYIINQEDFRNFAERYMTGSAGQKRVQKELLENYKITVPPVSEQIKIVDILSNIDQKITINKQLKEKLITLKKGLISDLLSGKVRTI